MEAVIRLILSYLHHSVHPYILHRMHSSPSLLSFRITFDNLAGYPVSSNYSSILFWYPTPSLPRERFWWEANAAVNRFPADFRRVNAWIPTVNRFPVDFRMCQRLDSNKQLIDFQLISGGSTHGLQQLTDFQYLDFRRGQRKDCNWQFWSKVLDVLQTI